MKSVLGIIAALLLTALLAALALRQITHDTHLPELAIATSITLISALLSLLPLALTRKSDPVVVFQAAFAGTIIHLFATLGMGGAVVLLQLVNRNIFVFLLLGFYWFSLIFIATAMIKIFRHSAHLRAAGLQAKST